MFISSAVLKIKTYFEMFFREVIAMLTRHILFVDSITATYFSNVFILEKFLSVVVNTMAHTVVHLNVFACAIVQCPSVCLVALKCEMFSPCVIVSVKGGEYCPMYQIFDSKYALSDYCCFVMCEFHNLSHLWEGVVTVCHTFGWVWSQFVTPLGGCGPLVTFTTS